MPGVEQQVRRALEKLCKWRAVFAGWQLGTRMMDDPEAQAVRDHREATILLRVEVSALVALLVDKGTFSLTEFQERLLEEAVALDRAYECRFPGIESTEHGIAINPAVVSEHHTMNGWR
jgi:hypothetical protein